MAGQPAMTIGDLARATGVAVKVRRQQDLGLTEAEIQQLAQHCDDNPGLVGPPLAALLQRSRDRIDAPIHELEQQRQLIDTFQHRFRDALTGQGACGTPDLWVHHPAESSGAA